jgi:hypothetical protein
LAGQDWLESFQYQPADQDQGQNQDQMGGKLSVLLSRAGFEQVQSNGIETLENQYSGLLTHLPDGSAAPTLSFARPAALLRFDLPRSVEFESLRYWRADTGGQVFLLEVASGWDVFSGHFPGHPILPGIMQLQWAAQFAHHLMNKPEIPDEVLQLKFHNVFVPPGWLILELSTKSESEIGFQLSSQAGVHGKGRLRYAG